MTDIATLDMVVIKGGDIEKIWKWNRFRHREITDLSKEPIQDLQIKR